jgi:hypothetical protein
MSRYLITDDNETGTAVYGEYKPPEMLLILGKAIFENIELTQIYEFLIKELDFMDEKSNIKISDHSCYDYDLITEGRYYTRGYYLSDLNSIREYFKDDKCQQMLLSLDWNDIKRRGVVL